MRGKAMISIQELKSKNRIAVAVLIIILFAQISFLQRYKEESSRFIVAFELLPEKGFNFTWPLESMHPAPYETVLMVVEKMPRVWDEKSSDRNSEPLLASRHLKVNGRLQKSLSIKGEQDEKERFLVKLDQGRLRLEISVPPGFYLDPCCKTAKIRLYQASKDQNR
jgi:hypothetical protein